MKEFDLEKVGLEEINDDELSKIDGGKSFLQYVAYYYGVFEGHFLNGAYMQEQASRAGAR